MDMLKDRDQREGVFHMIVSTRSQNFSIATLGLILTELPINGILSGSCEFILTLTFLFLSIALSVGPHPPR